MIKGTLISTPSGDIPVHDLAVGDAVTTPDGVAIITGIWVKESNRAVCIEFHRRYSAGNFTLTGDWDEEVFTLPDHDRKMGELHWINKIDLKIDIKMVEVEYNKRVLTYLLSLSGSDYYYANGVKVRGEHGSAN